MNAITLEISPASSANQNIPVETVERLASIAALYAGKNWISQIQYIEDNKALISIQSETPFDALFEQALQQQTRLNLPNCKAIPAFYCTQLTLKSKSTEEKYVSYVPFNKIAQNKEEQPITLERALENLPDSKEWSITSQETVRPHDSFLQSTYEVRDHWKLVMKFSKPANYIESQGTVYLKASGTVQATSHEQAAQKALQLAQHFKWYHGEDLTPYEPSDNIELTHTSGSGQMYRAELTCKVPVSAIHLESERNTPRFWKRLDNPTLSICAPKSSQPVRTIPRITIQDLNEAFPNITAQEIVTLLSPIEEHCLKYHLPTDKETVLKLALASPHWRKQ